MGVPERLLDKSHPHPVGVTLGNHEVLWEQRWVWGLKRGRDSQIQLAWEVMNPLSLEVFKNPDNYQSDTLEKRFSYWILGKTRGPLGLIPTPSLCMSNSIYRWVCCPVLDDLVQNGTTGM